MIRLSPRPDHIEDALVVMHTGQWFSWSDPENKVYANLVIRDDSITKPTEAEVNAKLAELQAAYDEANAPYKLSRRAEYPSLAEQLDMQYWDKINGTTTWADAIQAVKDKYPKPE